MFPKAGKRLCDVQKFTAVLMEINAVLVWLRPATKAPRGHPSPPPGCGGEWKETGRNWWVGIRAV